MAPLLVTCDICGFPKECSSFILLYYNEISWCTYSCMKVQLFYICKLCLRAHAGDRITDLCIACHATLQLYVPIMYYRGTKDYYYFFFSDSLRILKKKKKKNCVMRDHMPHYGGALMLLGEDMVHYSSTVWQKTCYLNASHYVVKKARNNSQC